MTTRSFILTSRALALAALFALPLTAQAAAYTSANRDILTPNTAVWPAAGVDLNGLRFVNLGLQGVGRIAAKTKDPVSGESFGSVSDLQITGWRSTGAGTYSGVFNFLPDRGYNSGTIFSNYAARINTVFFTFTPYTGAATTTSQNQIAMSVIGASRFTYDHDNNAATPPVFTTGLLADGVGTLFGKQVPVATAATTNSDGTVTGRLTVDAEALAFDNRPGKIGSGWLGDEYGANIYHFNASKQIDGIITLPAAAIPHSPVGTTNFLADPPVNGRRVNQGFEGVAVTPDTTKLFGLLQSATLQDSGSGNEGRSNTRLFVYDVSTSDTPTTVQNEYIIQLPRIDDNGGTPAVNRTGAQSSIIALNDRQLLILSRDGNGRGNTGAPVFKSVLLADISGATDIKGLYDGEGNAAAPAGALPATVTPIAWTEALNLIGKLDLSVSELEQFGLNLNTAPGDINTLSEKWEALALVPALDPSAPNDYFLFIGNDNDFISGEGKYLDSAGALQSYNAGLENDTIILAFRVQVVPKAYQQTECLFNWAEKNYASLFNPVGFPTSFGSNYLYRYYSKTNAYLGVSSADNNVYYLGPNAQLQNVGSVASWLPKAGCQ
jgi:hypothetical protein